MGTDSRLRLAGVGEVMAILGVSRTRARKLMERSSFPEPVDVLATGRVWLRADIEAFQAARSRKPGRPRKRGASGPVQEPVPLVAPFIDVLREWTDFDVAMFALGRAVGFFPAAGGFDVFQEFKYVFWSNNVLGSALGRALDALVAEGLLESDPPHSYRWAGGVSPSVEFYGSRRSVTEASG